MTGRVGGMKAKTGTRQDEDKEDDDDDDWAEEKSGGYNA